MTTYKEFNTALLQPFLSEVKSIASKISFNSGMSIEDMKKVDILKALIPIYNRLKEHPSMKLTELDAELMPHIKASVQPAQTQAVQPVPSAPPAYDADVFDDKDHVSSPDSEEIQSFLDMFNGDESDASSDEEDELEFDKDLVENMMTTSFLELKHVRNNRWYVSNPIDDDHESDEEFKEQETDSESEDEDDTPNEASVETHSIEKAVETSNTGLVEAGVAVPDAELFAKMDFRDKIGFFNDIEQKFGSAKGNIKPVHISVTRKPHEKETVCVPQTVQALYAN